MNIKSLDKYCKVNDIAVYTFQEVIELANTIERESFQRVMSVANGVAFRSRADERSGQKDKDMI